MRAKRQSFLLLGKQPTVIVLGMGIAGSGPDIRLTGFAPERRKRCRVMRWHIRMDQLPVLRTDRVTDEEEMGEARCLSEEAQQCDEGSESARGAVLGLRRCWSFVPHV